MSLKTEPFPSNFISKVVPPFIMCFESLRIPTKRYFPSIEEDLGLNRF